ncbi:MAG: aldo/keto reductase [Lachnospiraceae bacterium]
MIKALSNGTSIPMVGFGVFKTSDGEEAVNAVKWALEAGYRHIDTAYSYGNEGSVGIGMQESGVARDDIFLTTKLWNKAVRERKTRAYFEESLEKLQTDYVDLLLIHWPVDGKEEAWKVMEELYAEGKVKVIGVSNFHKSHYDELMEVATIKPMVNQIESNPTFNNQTLIDANMDMDIVVEAWSPLGGNGTSLLKNETLCAIAGKYNKSVAQVIIRWNLQRGVVVLPKSANKTRIAQNLDVFDFTLSREDMDAIMQIETGVRSGSDPDNFNF